MSDGLRLANLKKKVKAGSRVMEDGDGEGGMDIGSSPWGGMKEGSVREEGWGDPWSG